MTPLDDSVRQWIRNLAELGPLPAPAAALGHTLARALGELASSVPDAAPATRCGRELGELGFTDPAVIAASVPVLRRYLDRVCPGDGAALDAVLGGFGTGYAAALCAARAASERYEMVFRHATIAISISDEHGRILDANPAFERLTGRGLAELRTADSGYALMDPERRAEMRNLVRSGIESSRADTFTVEGRFPRADATMSIVAWTIHRCRSADSDRGYLLAFAEDITERRTATEQLQWQALHDPLTALPNRRFLLDRLATVIADAATDARAGICALDLDNFKHVNDTYGHSAGDRILTALSARLDSAAARQDCLLARTGGDEFIVLVGPPADQERLDRVVASLRAALREPFTLDGTELTMTMSIGAVLVHLAGADVEGLLDRSDQALYAVKAPNSGFRTRR
ncbi:sensor domain-containing diguanylate cyclase [Nocardia neocaledoniensis]|uniref:sensor domain-containing diguanylate cyclase n=1 Tax=Nocardia neocaledoniensis TaxID=236511 RepID=UPI002456D227|nr:sensor domain-containing diguanylate cyclase [Nocardia neocaledoniensis]